MNSLLFEQRIPPSHGWRYLGKTVMLIDERAVSQSEHSGLFYKTANDTVFIGGADDGSQRRRHLVRGAWRNPHQLQRA